MWGYLQDKDILPHREEFLGGLSGPQRKTAYFEKALLGIETWIP
jgi:hypothetical protein